MSRRGTGSAGQSGTEMIVILILVAFAAVAVVTLYGRHVGKKFSCAGQSVGNGGGAAPGCSGEEPNGGNGGAEVDAVSGAGPRVATSAQGAGSAGSGGPAAKAAEPKSEAASRKPGQASDDSGILPVLPTPSGGSSSAPRSGEEPAGETAVASNVPAIPPSANGASSAASGESSRQTRESTEDLSDFLNPGDGSSSSGPQALASRPLANAPALPSAGGGSGSAASGSGRSDAGQPVVIDNPSPVFQGDGSSGGGSAAPQVLRDTLVGPADGLPFPGSSGVSKAQLNDLVLGGSLPQRLNDAASDLRNKTSGGEGAVNGIVDRGTIVEVKGADGSTKLFRVTNPFKEVRDTRFGHVPEIGAVRDRSRVVVEAVGPGEKVDPKAPRIVVSDQQTTGEIALELSRQAARTALERGEEATLDRAIGADERTRIEALRPKVRSEFVNDTVRDAASAAARDIQRKKELERQGAAISTKLPFETEHQDAFNRAFAAELAKSGDPKAALAAANEAGRRAVEEAVRRNKSVADRAGKAFDRKFAQFAREHPDQLTEAERRHRIDELIQGLAELVNKVDPNSPEADKVIELVDAIVPRLSGADRIRFVNAADKGLNRLLGPFGFRVVEGVEVSALQLDRLDYALGNFDALNPKQRDEVRRSPVAAARLGIRLDPTAAELRARDRLVAIRALPDGTLHEGTLAEFREAAERNRINHILGQLDAIANAGPGALLGRIIDGERGAAIGAAIDAALPIVASVKARANVRAGIQSFPSGGHVVTGGPGGAGFEPVSGPGVPTADRLVPIPRTNVGEAGGDLVRRPETKPRQVTLRGAGPQPPRAPAPVEPKTGNPPAQERPRRDTPQTGNFESDVRRERARQEEVRRFEKLRDEEDRRHLERFPEETELDADERLEREARRDLEQAGRQPPVPGDGKSVSVDQALDRLEKGDPTIQESHSSKFHRFIFEKALNQKLGPGEEPPVAFTVGDGVRIDVDRLDPKQRERFQRIVRAGQARRAGNTGNPPTQPPPGGSGQQATRSEAKTGPLTTRSEAKTGKITRPGVAGKTAAAGNQTEPGPGEFGEEDVVFGLAKPRGRVGALAKFAGKARNAADKNVLPISKNVLNPPGGVSKAAVNEAIAGETVAFARGFLKQSGGKLRFSLDGFNLKQAITQGSKNFDSVTAFEFRKVLADPFLRERVRFFSAKGKDVTSGILKLKVPK